MADGPPVATSPIAPPPPVTVAHGWATSARRSTARLRITDLTPLAKVLIRAPDAGAVARHFDVALGHVGHREDGTLVTAPAPCEWWLLAPPGDDLDVVREVEDVARDEFVTVLDLTHERAALRLTGTAAAQTLARVCAIDLSDEITPNSTCFRSSVARVVTDVVRDDLEGERSYLLHFERSYGQYLFDALVDAGREWHIDIDGFEFPAHERAEVP